MTNQSLVPAVYIAVIRGSDYLVQRRTGGAYGDGQLSLVAGHLLPGEAPSDAARRELSEEIGVDPFDGKLEYHGSVHRASIEGGAQDRMDLFFVLRDMHEVPYNREPTRASELRWLPIDEPVPNTMVPEVGVMLRSLQEGWGTPWFIEGTRAVGAQPIHREGPRGGNPPTLRLGWDLTLSKTRARAAITWDAKADEFTGLGLHPDRNDFSRGVIVAEQDLCIECTTNCNAECGYCFSDSRPTVRANFLPEDVIRRTITSFRDSLLRVCLAGGEPLMHPSIASLLALPCDYPDVGFVLNTNGALRRDLDPLIVENQWLVAVSLHGLGTTHNAYTRTRSFDKVVARVQDLASVTVVHIYCVLNALTTEEDILFLYELLDRGVVRLRLITPRAFGRLGDPPSSVILAAAEQLVEKDPRVILKRRQSESLFLDVSGRLRKAN